MVKTAMQEIFNIRLSLGTIDKLRTEASASVEKALEEAKTYIQNAAVVSAHETRFSQKNMLKSRFRFTGKLFFAQVKVQ